MTTIASLPAALLWAAAFAASNDPTKGPICAIEVRKQGNHLRIVAVDGHRCFRCVVPVSEQHYCPDEPLRLLPKAFSKVPTKKALLVEIDDGGVATFKSQNGLVNSSVVCKADPWALSGQEFPNIDHIWPPASSMACTPGDFVAMNAGYVGDFMKVVAKLSTFPGNARLTTSDSPVSPIIWQAPLDDDWLVAGDGGETVWMDYLLMPVQVRR
jgi:hypothetical protein